jgi:TnpA family transposase
MIYWHVERKSVCVYSELKTCSSSEVAAMMEGLIRHGADIDSQITANHTDTHGPSVVGFAFTRLLGYRLLPRLKNIGAARLYRPADGASYPRLEPVLTRAITWNSANVAIHYGREAELPGADREAQEISMLCLHLLKSALGLAPRLDACCRTGSARGRRVPVTNVSPAAKQLTLVLGLAVAQRHRPWVAGIYGRGGLPDR